MSYRLIAAGINTKCDSQQKDISWLIVLCHSMSSLSDEEVQVSQEEIVAIQERALKAEKNKLHMDLARGINNEIEEIIREEIS